MLSPACGIFSLFSSMAIKVVTSDGLEVFLGSLLPAFRHERLGAEVSTSCCSPS